MPGDPEEKKPRRNQEQYEMLLRCSDKGDVTEWNDWRDAYPEEEVLLEGADLGGKELKGVNFGKILKKSPNAYLKGANFRRAHLEGANFVFAHLEEAHFVGARLEGAYFNIAHLEEAHFRYTYLGGTMFIGAHLGHADFRRALVDGETSFIKCNVDKDTDFRTVGLGNARIDAGTRQLLEYNARRMNWEEWYDRPSKHRLLRVPPFDRLYEYLYKKFFVRGFWLISDYGMSTGRILGVFLAFSVLFAILYRLSPDVVENLDKVGMKWVPGSHFLRALYFSLTVMTSLGFAEMHPAPGSALGYLLVGLQSMLGYVLLGALVTRLSVLFTSGGPAGEFSKRGERKGKTGGDSGGG